ncbi:MAG TPA: aminotransferase class V-fold PLP-dependent enzyme [Candidatus Saccharimonadales bacterium]|jgi:aspartate aminotransferase-like enzyme|nr:aminotransferase class V-fold PLP-dependent enzyme [Candidatus Saccharimonadales bacterium]
MSTQSLQFKVATEDWEFEQVHQLNYKTFVEEIPQHQPSNSPRLVDKFHSENTYLICLSGRRVVGMSAARGRRPFSLDQKIPNLDSHLPPGRRVCEIRLLSVEKQFRNGQVFRGLTTLMWQFGLEHGYDLAVISGTTRQQKLYRHLGFVPFGPQVGMGDAMFQPMYLTLENFEKQAEEFLREPIRARGPASFLPGPVAIHAQVRQAFERVPESHRSDHFISEFQSVRQRLCQLVRARDVQILLGSGTLANDAVAAQLLLDKNPGLILSNGEFGERLIDHAARMGLTFDTLKFRWGETFNLAAIEQYLSRSPAVGWLWCVHSETSTGLLNPLSSLQSICARAEVRLCADCISSIGLVPVNLEGIYLASGASGKGLAGYPGLCMVFHNHALASSKALPRYVDLGWYAEHQGIAFTHSSNLVQALDAAVRQPDWPKKLAEGAAISSRLRASLRSMGFQVVASDADATPGVVSIALPQNQNSAQLGAQLQRAGYLLSFNSDYLRQRNWIQICLMGEYSPEKLESLLNWLAKNAAPSRNNSPVPMTVAN